MLTHYITQLITSANITLLTDWLKERGSHLARSKDRWRRKTLLWQESVARTRRTRTWRPSLSSGRRSRRCCGSSPGWSGRRHCCGDWEIPRRWRDSHHSWHPSLRRWSGRMCLLRRDSVIMFCPYRQECDSDTNFRDIDFRKNLIKPPVDWDQYKYLQVMESFQFTRCSLLKVQC